MDPKPKKTRIVKDKWKRNIEKRNRHTAKGFPSLPTCTHSKTFYCPKLKLQDVRRFHQSFYETPNKVDQDNFILKHTKQLAPAKNRKRKNYERLDNNVERKSCISIKYFVLTRLEGMVQVAPKLFLQFWVFLNTAFKILARSIF
uniref:Uncharacterized protein LOC114342129 n=1 Tax=Diabrotica virgifera virgifera TaxID=50390 RepID=A0A6P7GIE7_DIAVI